MIQYVKCLAILISNCYGSKIVDERNFNINDISGIQSFYSKYSDDKYRCFQAFLKD